MEAGDDGPLAGVSIDLDGHGHLFALATRKAIAETCASPWRSRVRPGQVGGDSGIMIFCQLRAKKGRNLTLRI